MAFIRRYLIAGLLVWLPICVTLLVLKFLIGILDSLFSLIPNSYQPAQWAHFSFPGVELVISLLILLFTGVLATNFFGRHMMNYVDKIIHRIPFIRTIYSATKQLTQSLFSSNSNAFRKVVLVQYPRQGCWSLAFLTGNASTEISKKIGVEVLSIFIPTTPNPTSGFLLLLPKTDVIELDMSVDQALKLIISLGVVQAGTAALTDKNVNAKPIT